METQIHKCIGSQIRKFMGTIPSMQMYGLRNFTLKEKHKLKEMNTDNSVFRWGWAPRVRLF